MYTIVYIICDKLIFNTSYATRSVLLPRSPAAKRCVVGAQIRAAGLRRNLPIALIAERAQCSHVTVGKIEKGDPTVSMGAYLRVLYALQPADDIDCWREMIRSAKSSRTSNCEKGFAMKSESANAVAACPDCDWLSEAPPVGTLRLNV